MKVELLKKSELLINKQVVIHTTLGDFFEGVLSGIKAKGNIIYYFLDDTDGVKARIPETTIIDIEGIH